MKKTVRLTTGLMPVPVVMVSCGDMQKSDIVTIAWAGTVNSEPPMLSISVRRSRYSYSMIKESGEFVVNIVNRELLEKCDGCGTVSGRDADKFNKFLLTKEKSEKVSAPSIAESPVNLECVVKQTVEMPTHVMFIAEIVNVRVREDWVDGLTFKVPEDEVVAYVQNRYVETGKTLGTYGFTALKK